MTMKPDGKRYQTASFERSTKNEILTTRELRQDLEQTHTSISPKRKRTLVKIMLRFSLKSKIRY